MRSATTIAIFLILFIASNNSYASDSRALLVGIDKYELPPGQSPPKNASRKRWTNLDGSVADAEGMKELLIKRFAFKSENVHLLKDNEARRDRIFAEIRDHLLKPAQKGDISFFFYAGHGSQRLNSESSEPDKKDETIVPADSNLGVDDIRDKELRELFNQIVDKQILLTVIFDSCHSGSIIRGPGKARRLEADMRDIKQSGDPPAPEERGALVLSAAQDYEPSWETTDEQGLPHGAFIYALIKTLRTANPKEASELTFQRAKALMDSDGSRQVPVISGSKARKSMPLFGGNIEVASSVVVAVERVEANGIVILQGGRATNLFEDTELIRIGNNMNRVRIKIKSVKGLAQSSAQVIEGEANYIHAGDLFKVDRWIVPDKYNLKVWIPPAVNQAEAFRITEEVFNLRSNQSITLIDDPTVQTPSHYVTFEKDGWKLYQKIFGSDGNEIDTKEVLLGKTLTSDLILKKLAGTKSAKLLIDIPPTSDLTKELRLGDNSIHNAIAVTSDPSTASYVLVGRSNGKSLEYAWVKQGAIFRNIPDPNLPLRTDWFEMGKTSESTKQCSNQLESYCLRLGKITAWLTIEAPPNEGNFPYHLALKNSETGQIMSNGTIKEGENYGLVLVADPTSLKRVEKRWVYVFSLDSHGNSTLLFPRGGNVENRVPYGNMAETPPEIQLGGKDLFEVTGPFGTDTYFLLASAEEIATPDVLEYEGVRLRSDRTRGEVFGLEYLLSETGAATRGNKKITPTHWSISSFGIVSRPK